jgi:hypothetical protein
MIGTLFGYYEYLYYRQYKWLVRNWGIADAPEYTSAIVLTMLSFMNVVNALQLTEILGLGNVFSLLGSSSAIPIIGFICLGLAHYFMFIKGARYHGVIERFDKKVRVERTRGFICCLMYWMATLTLFFGMVWLRQAGAIGKH